MTRRIGRQAPTVAPRYLDLMPEGNPKLYTPYGMSPLQTVRARVAALQNWMDDMIIDMGDGRLVDYRTYRRMSEFQTAPAA